MVKMTLMAAMLIIVLYGDGHAASPTFMVYGIGSSTCGDLIKNVDNRAADKTHNLMAISWVQGYVTAMSEVVEPMERMTAASATSFLDKYCREKPADTIQAAADTLVGQLWTDNPKRRSP